MEHQVQLSVPPPNSSSSSSSSPPNSHLHSAGPTTSTFQLSQHLVPHQHHLAHQQPYSQQGHAQQQDVNQQQTASEDSPVMSGMAAHYAHNRDRFFGVRVHTPACIFWVHPFTRAFIRDWRSGWNGGVFNDILRGCCPDTVLDGGLYHTSPLPPYVEGSSSTPAYDLPDTRPSPDDDDDVVLGLGVEHALGHYARLGYSSASG
ncbi:hypothetical protein BDQ12DRAFT_725406 [Crucibulum laeve]|uniref:Uncharacterized protein n=1 Tax=Crucibulum laeve TaxID=68775 RepID=A0A5C3LW18_9AGAR|nr:hypothetical protein BDQ12DRAFT_725406 [Crucibulum laeve]